MQSSQPNSCDPQLKEQIKGIQKEIDQNIKEISEFVDNQQNKIIDDFLIFKEHIQNTLNEQKEEQMEKMSSKSDELKDQIQSILDKIKWVFGFWRDQVR